MISYWLHFRLRAYAAMTGRVLQRHWKAVVLTLLLSSPLAMPMVEQVQAVGSPILALLSDGHSWAWYFAYVLALQLVGVLWSSVQREMILGGEFTPFVATLPVPSLKLRRVDATVLLLADSIPLIPTVAALISLSTAPIPAVQKFGQIASVVVPSCVIFAAQLCVLARQRAQLLGVGLATLLLAISLASQMALVMWSCQALAALIAFFLIVIPAGPAVRHGHRVFTHRGRITAALRWVMAIVPAAYLEARILAVARPWSTVCRLSLAGLAAIGINRLVHVERCDARAVPSEILLLPVLALLLSGFYRVLSNEHRLMSSYLRALPIAPHFWALRDTASIVCLSLPFSVVALMPLFRYTLSTALVLIVMQALLIALLRITQLRLQQCVLWSAAAAAIWSSVLWAWLV